VRLSAAGSSDPEDQATTANWFVYREAHRRRWLGASPCRRPRTDCRSGTPFRLGTGCTISNRSSVGRSAGTHSIGCHGASTAPAGGTAAIKNSHIAAPKQSVGEASSPSSFAVILTGGKPISRGRGCVKMGSPSVVVMQVLVAQAGRLRSPPGSGNMVSWRRRVGSEQDLCRRDTVASCCTTGKEAGQGTQTSQRF
jgi:hypothetical protein